MSSDTVNGNEPNIPKPPTVPIPKPSWLDATLARPAVAGVLLLALAILGGSR